MMRFGPVLLVVLFAACTAAQEFPFKNGPLDPSLHSNKIFFETESIDDVAGVWLVTSIVMPNILQRPEVFSGGVPLNEVCQRAAEEGLHYRYEKVAPQDAIILPAKEEGELGRVIDTRVHRFDERIITGWSDGVMRFDQEDLCRTWRPYFDWEVGKAMFLRTRRFVLYEDENGDITGDSDVCVYGGIDHPFCTEGSFIIDGQEVNGVIVDAVMYYECTAGPCLELPHTLPGYVKTQGWQPRD